LSSSIELLDSKTFGLQYANVSYGRRTDADLSWREFQMPTPNASNISTSIANVYQNSDITVFPNPSTGVFNIRINGLNETNYGTSIKVCDIAGRVIYEKIISTDQILLNDKFQFDLSEFTKGTYIIKYNNYSQLIILR
jgi:hypothetical protein